MADRICPACGRGVLTRCGRRGLWEQYVLPLFGIYPWRCGRCRVRFRLSDRGADFQRFADRTQYFDDVTPAEAAQPQYALEHEDTPSESASKDDGRG